ncbi:Hypothetical protein FKW44_013272 [Caligus rogercresseyi]|uniref:Uncharacterized protein n=1 Tax=Caligus rogercresseyi TaxID=217165 RepID=A0A7T8HKZ6_CALRO|nr:Hypothetical protein FKW44_013272 [Caligus rogercresseyi]
MVPIPLSHVFSIYEQVPCGSKKNGDAIGVGRSRKRLSTSSITALKLSQSLKLWKR